MRRAKERTSISPAEQKEIDEKDLRALSLCIGMLERVNGVRAPMLSDDLALKCYIRRSRTTSLLKAFLPISSFPL